MAQDISKVCKYHNAPNTFYCYTDKEGYCGECVEEDKHKGHQTISRANLVKFLEHHYDRKTTDIRKKIDSIKTQQSVISSSQQKCDAEIQVIESFYKKFEDTFKGAVCRHKDRLASGNTRAKATAQEILARIEQEIKQFEEEIGQVDKEKAETQKWKTNSDLQNLINRYQDIEIAEKQEGDHAVPAPVDNPEVQQLAPPLADNQQFKQPEFAEKKTIVFVDILHGEGVETAAVQSERDHVYCLSSFSPDIYYYDLQERVGSKFEMVLQDNGLYEPPYNGRLFITGGTSNLETPLKSCVEFSRMTQRVMSRPEMLHERTEHGMVAHNKQLYVVSGRSKDGYTQTFERIAVSGVFAEAAWTELAQLNVGRSFLSLCIFTTGPTSFLYAFAGQVEDHIEPAIERVRVAGDKDTWELIKGLPEGIILSHSAGAVQLGESILLFGGVKADGSKSKDVYSYQPNAKKFGQARELQAEEQFYGRTPVIYQNCVYAVGSCDIHVCKIEDQSWDLLLEQNWQVY